MCRAIAGGLQLDYRIAAERERGFFATLGVEVRIAPVRAADGDGAGFEVHVVPLEPEQLAEPHAGPQAEKDQRGQMGLSHADR
jgi:hypothetical protein